MIQTNIRPTSQRYNITISRNFVRFISLVSILVCITGCSLFGNKRPAYQGAEYYKNLEVPPDLTQPDKTDVVHIPQPSRQALERFQDNNKLATVILPKFKGVRVVNDAGSSWLEVDAPVEKVWPALKKFWQQEGVGLAQVQPLLGFMETKWIARKDKDAGFISSMFQRFEPDQKDKFRLRVERFDHGKKTRIFVAHTGIERVVQEGDGNDYIWVTLPSNVEREREIVARLALFAGLSEKQQAKLAANYSPYASLVTLDPRNSIALTMKGSLAFVHRRALRALDRMRMQAIKPEGDTVIHFTVANLDTENPDSVNADKEDSSWLAKLFSSDKEDASGNKKVSKNRQLKLIFTDQQGSVRIEVRDERYGVDVDEEGDVSSSPLAEKFRNKFAKALE